MDDPRNKMQLEEPQFGRAPGERAPVSLEACGITAQDIRRIVAKLQEEKTKHDGKDIDSDS